MSENSELIQTLRILIPGAQAWLAGVWWLHRRSSPEPGRSLPGNSASRCVDLVRSGQTRSPSKDVLPQRGLHDGHNAARLVSAGVEANNGERRFEVICDGRS